MRKQEPIKILVAQKPTESRAYNPTAGLSSTCPQIKTNDHRGHVFPAVSGFQERDFHYRSVVTQIPHDVGLALILHHRPYTLADNLTSAVSNSTNS